jgi:hypothetical protein
MWKILFYEDHRGKTPALEYINNLPTRDKVKVSNTLRLLEEFGTSLTIVRVITDFFIAYMMANNL